MRYLGFVPERIRVGVFDLTGCEGCQLQWANKEETLAAFLAAVHVAAFREISSESADDYDIAFIDGAVSRDDEVERLVAIRGRARVVVAMGSCACFGGVQRMRNAIEPDVANRLVYGDAVRASGPVRAVSEVVDVDVALPGCPVDKTELERLVQHLALGLEFQFPVYPVCVECKQRFVTCAMELGQLCLGPITRGGCDAPCPAGGLACWGCRGPALDANMGEFRRIVAERGHSEEELHERLGFFGGFEGM